MESIESTTQKSEIIDFIDACIAHFQTDKEVFKQGVQSRETQSIYNALLSSPIDFASQQLNATKQALFNYILANYLQHLHEIKDDLVDLGISSSKSALNIWAIIEEDDEATEKQLFRIEAKVNAIFHETGLHIDTLVMEDSDNYPMPPQYRSVFAPKK